MLAAMTAVDNIVAGRSDKANIWAVNTEMESHASDASPQKDTTSQPGLKPDSTEPSRVLPVHFPPARSMAPRRRPAGRLPRPLRFAARNDLPSTCAESRYPVNSCLQYNPAAYPLGYAGLHLGIHRWFMPFLICRLRIIHNWQHACLSRCKES